MISRALEKQILDFVALLESQLARLIHAGHERTKHLPRVQRDAVLRNTLIVAWRRREHLNPLNEPVSVWFERCVHTARYEEILPDADELVMLDFLSPTPTVASHNCSPSSHEGGGDAAAVPGSDASQALGKECPPCWRCRYFDGWLPKRWPYGKEFKPSSEIDLVCYEIDKRKVKIAEYVQGAYDPRLLED